jgi:phage terminase small subunit
MSSSGDLTPKQERFCIEYIETGNASEAYRKSYNAENMKPESIHREAFELLRSPKIASRLKEYSEANELTVQSVMDGIKRLAKKAESNGKFNDALKAHELLGKHLQAFTDKQVVDTDIKIRWEE